MRKIEFNKWKKWQVFGGMFVFVFLVFGYQNCGRPNGRVNMKQIYK